MKKLRPAHFFLLTAFIMAAVMAGFLLDTKDPALPKISVRQETVSAAVPPPVSRTNSHPLAQIPPTAPEKASLSARLDRFLEMARGDADAYAFESFFASWIASLEPVEVPSVLASLQRAGLEKEFRADVESRLIRRWSESDGASAAAWVAGMPPGKARELSLENVAIVRADQAPEAASAWARQWPKGAERDVAIAAVANEAVRTQPVQAICLAVELPAGAASDDLIRRAAMEWATKDAGSARAWAEQLPNDDALRDKVLAGLALAWADQDPAAAAALVAEKLPEGRLQADAAIGVAQRWAQHDPVAVAAWVEKFPPGELKRNLLGNVLAQRRN